MPFLTSHRIHPHPNGNITSQHRHNQAGNPIDQFSYKYLKDLDEKLYQNRLYAVIDDVPAIDFPDDIDGIDYAFVTDPALINTDNNYGYDQLGQLVRDDEESIEEIIWRIDGKISSILREDASNKSELSFVYDALGNRVAQKVYDDEGNWQKTTYYSRDAQGNVMAVYEYTEVESEPVLSFSEVHKYGSSRLGIRIPQGTPDLIGATDPTDDETLSLERGHDRFELSNHLGNVLSIVSDRILPIEDGNTGIVSHHRPEVLTVMDYYPFGVMMEDRSYTDLESHRFGFQGQEMDDDIYGEGNALTFKYRVHDARLGRFLSIDPLAPEYPWNSPYAFSENRVIDMIELEGKETFIAILSPDATNEIEVVLYEDIYGEVSGSMGLGTAYFTRLEDGQYSFEKYVTPDHPADVAQMFAIGFGLAESGSSFIKDSWFKSQASGMAFLLGTSWNVGLFMNAMDNYRVESEKFFPDKEEMQESARDMVQIIVTSGFSKVSPFIGEALDIVLSDSRSEDGITNTQNLSEAYSYSNRQIKQYQNEHFGTNHDVSTRASRIQDRGEEMECELQEACE